MSYLDDLRKVANSNLPWDMLSGKNILVIGATGMIGSAFVEMLLLRNDADYTIYACSRSKEKFNRIFADYQNHPNLHYLECDVTKPIQSNRNFQIIVYCAGIASPSLYKSNPVGVMTSNLMGVNNIMSYGVAHGLEKFLYVSSGEVYGEGTGETLKEENSGYVDCTQLRAVYPSAKRATESLCIAYSHQYNVDVVISRPCHVYGPKYSVSDNRVYAEFIRKVLSKDNIVLKSKGDQIRSWCYVADCVSGLIHILLKGENRKAYNIADSASVISIRELAEMFASIGNTEVVYDLPTEEEQSVFNPMKHSTLDSSRLCSLGWKCEGNMKSKIQKTIEARRILKDRITEK